MKKIISLVLCISALLSLCLLSSCSTGKTKESFNTASYTLFDTHSVILGYEYSKEDFDKNSALILDELEIYHRLFDIYYEYEGINNLKTVNDNAGIAPVKVDKKIIDLLLFAKEIYELTDKNVNVCMGSVLSLWHDYRDRGLADPKNASLPSMEELRERAEHTDMEKLIIDTEESTVFLTDSEMSLDVGAIAKGYAVERIAEMMEEKKISGYALNVGGNVRTVGTKDGGEKWSVGVQNPDLTSDKAYIVNLALEDLSLVTSGTYQRYYTVEGKQYHHIIDPDTLFPGDNFASVSILCKNSGMADALSTALFNMSEKDGRALLKSLDGVEAAWIYPDGKYSCTNGFEKTAVD